MADHEVDYASVCERLVQVSDRISTQVRTLAIGVLAILWALWTTDSAAARNISGYLRYQGFWLAAVAVLALLSDFGQYVSGYVNSLLVKKRMEDQKVDKALLDYSAPLYVCQNILFFVKQALVAICTIWLLIVLGVMLIQHGSEIPASKTSGQQRKISTTRSAVSVTATHL